MAKLVSICSLATNLPNDEGQGGEQEDGGEREREGDRRRNGVFYHVPSDQVVQQGLQKAMI